MPRCVLSQESLPPQPTTQDEQIIPLTVEEKRLILGQLFELESYRKALAAYQELQEQKDRAHEQEREYWNRALEVERDAAALIEREKVIVERERDLALERAKFYEDAYLSLTKKGGFGCVMKKIFTLGIASCR